MEETIKVKEVKEVKGDPQEISTPQNKEQAVMDEAVKNGELDESYSSISDDGTHVVNLDKPIKKEKNAVPGKTTKSVQNVGSESIESREDAELALRGDPVDKNKAAKDTTVESKLIKNKTVENKEDLLKDKITKSDSPLELIEETKEEDLKEKSIPPIKKDIEQQKNVDQVLPENLDKLVKFMDETGGSLEDYVNLNKDLSKMDNTSVLREYYKNTKPHLDASDIDFLFNKNFNYDEEADDPSDIKAKQLAFKEELYNAQNHFKSSREQYYADLKLRKQNSVAPEYKEAMDYYNNSKQQSEEYNNLQKTFLEKTDKVFNDNFKGFDFKVGESKYRFKVDNSSKVKEYQSDISNFINDFLDDKGAVDNAEGYHRALFAAKNADKLASHFYEQGRADAIRDSAKKAKNINMDPRKDNSSIVTSRGDTIKVVSGDSSDKLRIKWK